jgi:hypothetical protein
MNDFVGPNAGILYAVAGLGIGLSPIKPDCLAGGDYRIAENLALIGSD